MSSTSSYLNHFRLHRMPYRQQPDPEVFFVEAGRGEILQNLCLDIIGGKPLVRLTGGEGTGKTLLYLLLARKLGIKKFEVVSLDHPVGSFDDLLQTICRALEGSAGEAAAGRKNGQGYPDELLGLLKERSRAGQRVVLLIDEAEQLFLATLERLVRLIGEIGQEKLLQVVLIGRPELDRNLQQLSSYCDDADIRASYSLVPLSLDETGRYLCFQLVQAGSTEEKATEIFSDGAVAALFDKAKGNLSLTNLLAEEGLRAAYEAGRFQVHAELISPRQSRQRSYASALAPIKTWLRSYRLPVIGGASLCLVLLLVVFWPEKEEPPAPDRETEVVLEKNEPVAPPAAEKPLATETPAEKGAEAEAAISSPAPDEGTRDEHPGEKPAADEVGQLVSLAKIVTADEVVPPVPDVAVPSPPLPEPAPVEPATAPAAAGTQALPATLPAEANKVVVLRAEARKKKVGAAAGAEKQPAPGSAKDPEQVYAERLRASSRWRSRSGYTIQLMALASEDAEANFRKLLAQKRYAVVQDQLFLVHKAIPPTLFVYYGYFSSMEEARLGRDRLPDFLLKNRPYPLPIDQAAKKAEK